MESRLPSIQRYLSLHQLNGWLLYDFRRTNPLACDFLKIPSSALLTRRFFYWIPQKGSPIKIVPIIEPHHLDHLPGEKIQYRSWQELEKILETTLEGSLKIAMEYSPRSSIPAISKVDGGTVDLIRSYNVEVVSSADLLQQYTSTWDVYQLQTHLKAAEVLDRTVAKAWLKISQCLKSNSPISDYDVQQFILNEFEVNDCMTEGYPICALNAYSADPHYTPSMHNSQNIKKGDFILIDLWCKQKLPNAVYADITRVGFGGDKPSSKQQTIFEIVKKAQTTAKDFVRECFKHNKPVMGCEVDQVCRDVIEEAGYGEYFVHRTGHNIGTKDHGDGAHLDNLETHDTRLLLKKTCFSIEPGIYLPGEFGVRLEYDVYVHDTGEIQVTGGTQDTITTLATK